MIVILGSIVAHRKMCMLGFQLLRHHISVKYMHPVQLEKSPFIIYTPIILNTTFESPNFKVSLETLSNLLTVINCKLI